MHKHRCVCIPCQFLKCVWISCQLSQRFTCLELCVSSFPFPGWGPSMCWGSLREGCTWCTQRCECSLVPGDCISKVRPSFQNHHFGLSSVRVTPVWGNSSLKKPERPAWSSGFVTDYVKHTRGLCIFTHQKSSAVPSSWNADEYLESKLLSGMLFVPVILWRMHIVYMVFLSSLYLAAF